MAYFQGMAEYFLLGGACPVYLVLNRYVDFFPKSWHAAHACGMGLAHAFLYFVRMGVDDELGSFAKRKVRPSSFENMGEWQKIDDSVLFCYGHALVIGF